ncbi:MAG: leucyl aminopeptidase family protein [Gammaproteobacteria bacterium]|nr:leucyl aminopeptidase family protein [Gammaproteobacteria bacterium]
MSRLAFNKFIGNQLKISQSVGQPDASTFSGIDQLLVVLPEKIADSAWRQIPGGSRLKTLLKRQLAGRVPAVSSHLDNKRQTTIHLGHLDADHEPFERLTSARKLVAAALREKAGTVGLWVIGFKAADQQGLIEDMLSAALAAACPLPAFKAKDTPRRIKSLRIIGIKKKIDVRRVKAEASGNNLARCLTALPPNKLDAREYVKLLRELARTNSWQFKKYGVGELKKMGAGAFLAVAQGNADDSAAIVRLRYRPAGQSKSPVLSLVGKGIIFDTGGTNLKPFTSMLDMHIDMGGSAVAVGTLQALTDLGVPFAIDCWLAITENRTGPTAYKSQDVVTAANGTTIQTIHTDAEGRMALADTLVFASRDKPAFILDYATLTGACMTAITTRYSGVFTNHPDLHPVLKKSGRDSGERVWPFPIGKEFLEELKSDTADLMQCSANGGGDHILAASFLNEFVDAKIPWVHVDLSACKRKGGLAHIPTDITGFGVRFSLHLILDKNVLNETRRRRESGQ